MKKTITIGYFILLTLLVTASSGGAQLGSARSSTVIARCVGGHEAGLAYAYESLFRTCAIRPKVKAIVEFTITPRGSVEDVKVLKTEGFDTSPDGAARARTLGDKITEAAYTWRFPDVESFDATVDIPFLFVPVEGEEKKIGESEKPPEEGADYYGKSAKRGVNGVYLFEEFIIECRRARAVPLGVARAKPEGGVFARAAGDTRLDGEAKKPIRDYLKEIAAFLDERGEGTASKLSKKLASRARELADVEAALADEELRAEVDDLGLSKDYNWRIKKANAKKAAKLSEKRERLSLEIEKLAKDIRAAEETRSRSLAGERTALIATGERLLGSSSPSDATLSARLALAELHLDGDEGAKAAPLFQEVIENGEGETVAEAFYGLAHSYLAAGDEENAAQAFLLLMKGYPDSGHYDEACFRLADNCASLSKPVKAGEYYNLAAASDGPYRDVARYRAGWTYYECSSPLGEEYYGRAARAFKRFLDEADESSPYWDHAVEMAGLCLAEWEPDAADALGRYEEVFAGAEEGPYAADILRTMGDAYLYRMDKLPEAGAAYETLLEKYPFYGQAPAVAESLVETYLRREAYDDAHDVRIRIADEYGPDSSWYRAQDDLARCRALISWEDALYEVAVYFNMQAERKIRKHPEEARPLFGNAIDRYNQYLTSFPTNDKAYHINFYLAECYYSIEDYETAAQQYIKTATHYTDRERYKMDKWDEMFTGEQSFYKAIVARDEIFQEEVMEGEAVPDAEESRRKDLARPLTANDAELARVCNTFIERYPESKEVPTILSKLGEVYFYAGDYESARESYAKVVNDYAAAPDPGYQKRHDQIYVNAAESIAKSYFNEAEFYEEGAAYEEARRRYELANEWYDRTAREAEARKVTETVERARTLAGFTGLKAAEMLGAGVPLDEAGVAPASVTRYDFVELYPPLRPIVASAVKVKRAEAEEYEAVAEEYGATCPDVGRLALGKAAETYYEVRDWANASRGYLDYVGAYPGVEDVKEAYGRAAESCERTADWAGAAEIYLRVAGHAEFKGTDFGRDCLLRAGLMYEQLEDWAKAAATFGRFVEEYPDYATTRIEATYRLARAEEKLGRAEDSLEYHKQVVALYKISMDSDLDIAGTERFVAESYFKVTDAKFDEYEAIKFVMPEDVLKDNLQRKVDLSQDLTSGYGEAYGIGIPEWSVAARCRLGDVYYEFAETLLGYEIPQELRPEYWKALPESDERKPLLEMEYNTFISQLEEQAAPLKEKAALEYRDAVGIAEAEGIDNEWSRKARERLSALASAERRLNLNEPKGRP